MTLLFYKKTANEFLQILFFSTLDIYFPIIFASLHPTACL